MSLSLFPAGKRGRERAGDWLLGRPTLSARQSSIEGRPYASTGCASAAAGAGIVSNCIRPRRFGQHAGAVDIEASSHILTIVQGVNSPHFLVAGRTRTVRPHITRQMLEGHILQQLARAGSKGMGSS